MAHLSHFPLILWPGSGVTVIKNAELHFTTPFLCLIDLFDFLRLCTRAIDMDLCLRMSGLMEGEMGYGVLFFFFPYQNVVAGKVTTGSQQASR
jgi:hypothetical protein